MIVPKTYDIESNQNFLIQVMELSIWNLRLNEKKSQTIERHVNINHELKFDETEMFHHELSVSYPSHNMKLK